MRRLAATLLASVTVASLATSAAPTPAAAASRPTARGQHDHRPMPMAARFLHVGAAAGPAGLPQIVDRHGRAVLLRGVNVNGLEDYYSTATNHTAPAYPVGPKAYRHGRCPARNHGVESVPVCRFDAKQWRRLGYDAIRLGLSWSLLEPTPGHIDQRYVARIAQVVRWAHRQHVYVVLDMHQDAWSKFLYTPAGRTCPPPFAGIGNGAELDGAPKWASTHLTPVCDLQQREFDTAVIEDFQRFWSDVKAPDGVGLQEHFAAVVTALARRFHHDPTVAGYELFNEPSPGTEPPPAMDETTLFPFYAKVIATVRAAVPRFHQLVFFEPDITRDITDRSAIVTPWSTYSPYRNVVYAPHVYTGVFTPDADLAGAFGTPRFLPMNEGYDSAVRDARALGTPLWIGEFGNNVSDDSTMLRQHYENQDANGIGSSLWVWKASATNAKHTDGWSVLHGPFGHGVPFPSRVHYTSRAYPVYLAGRLRSLRYDPDHEVFTLRATASRVRPGHDSRATLVFIPRNLHGAIHVSGANLRIRRTTHHTRYAYIYPHGGPYRLHVRD